MQVCGALQFCTMVLQTFLVLFFFSFFLSSAIYTSIIDGHIYPKNPIAPNVHDIIVDCVLVLQANIVKMNMDCT
jgi:hypothetical protein